MQFLESIDMCRRVKCSTVRQLNLIWQRDQTTLAGNEVHINIWIGMIILMFFHEVLLIDKFHTQHVSGMPVMQPDVEPAHTVIKHLKC